MPSLQAVFNEPIDVLLSMIYDHLRVNLIYNLLWGNSKNLTAKTKLSKLCLNVMSVRTCLEYAEYPGCVGWVL